jgi:hypothetical protein
MRNIIYNNKHRALCLVRGLGKVHKINGEPHDLRSSPIFFRRLNQSTYHGQARRINGTED